MKFKKILIRKPIYPSPRYFATWISRSLSLWIFSVLRTKPKFTTEKTYDVNKLLDTNYSEASFEKCWTNELLGSLDKMISPKLIKAIWCRFGAGFTIIIFYLLFIQIFCILQVYYLFFAVTSPNNYNLLSLLLSFLIYNLLKFNWNKTVHNMGIQLRVGIQSLLLKKLLLVDTNKISTEELNKKALIFFERLFQIGDLIHCIPYLIIFVLYVSILTFVLCYTHSNHLPTILMTSFVLCVIIPIKSLFYNKIQSEINRDKKNKMNSLKIIDEVMTFWVQIKMYCLENDFIARLINYRKKNIKHKTSQYINEVMLSFLLLNFVTLMSFLYYLCHGQIWASPDVKNVMPAIAIFQIFVYPISVYSSKSIMLMVQFFKTVTSLEEILTMMDRCEQNHCPQRRKETETSLKICGVSLKLKKINLFVNLNLGIGTAKLICFSKLDSLTKANLLRLLLKEVDPFEGTVEIYGKIAFCSNKPWLFPRATVKKNIICSLPFNIQRFQHVLNICELNSEFFKNLILNDTLIGESGDENITKEVACRISIARVLYNDSEIQVFDRPLECMNRKKAERIMKHLMDNLCAYRKTVIAFSDKNYITSKAHRIFHVVMGTFEEKNNISTDEDTDGMADTESEELYSHRTLNNNSYSSHAPFFQILAFINTINGKKYKNIIFIILCIMSGLVMEALSTIWIVSALRGNVYINWDNSGLVDIILPIVLLSLSYCYSIKYTYVEFLESVYVNILHKLVHLPLWNKDERNTVLWVLEHDFDEIEHKFLPILIMFMHYLLVFVISSAVVFVCTPLIGLALFINMSVVYYFMKCSPFLIQLEELSDGLMEILRNHYTVKESQVLSLRSLGATDAYIQQMYKYFNRLTSTQYLISVIEETASFWVCIVSGLNIVGVIVLNSATDVSNDSLSLYFSLVLPSVFPFLIKYFIKFLRIWVKLKKIVYGMDWQKNEIESDISMDYCFMKNTDIYTISHDSVQFYTFPDELIAVTGVDNVDDIYGFLGFNFSNDSTIDDTFKCSFVPSEPHIFKGNLKTTLNPCNLIYESDLWSALSKTGISHEIIQFPLGLMTESENWDEIFTVYQRQLLFLSVQIAMQNKTIVIQTDAKHISYYEELDLLIKVKKYLNKSKIFLFSNRLRIACQCDKIMIMQNGLTIEFGAPEKLLNDKNSYLYSYVQNMKDVSIKKLILKQ